MRKKTVPLDPIHYPENDIGRPTASLPGFSCAIFDVGQGNCTVIRHEDCILIVDAGSKGLKPIIVEDDEEINIEGVIKVIARYINVIAVKQITIIISHLDSDHYNYLPILVELLYCRNKIIYFHHRSKPDAENPLAKTTKQFTEKFGQLITLEYLKGEEALHWNGRKKSRSELKKDSKPFEPIYINNIKNIDNGSNDVNRNSLVVTVTYNGQSILLPGDAHYETIKSDCVLYPKDKHYLLYNCAHHGARTEKSHEIINLITFDTIIFSAKVSKHGHPSIDAFKAAVDRPKVLTPFPWHGVIFDGTLTEDEYKADKLIAARRVYKRGKRTFTVIITQYPIFANEVNSTLIYYAWPDLKTWMLQSWSYGQSYLRPRLKWRVVDKLHVEHLANDIEKWELGGNGFVDSDIKEKAVLVTKDEERKN